MLSRLIWLPKFSFKTVLVVFVCWIVIIVINQIITPTSRHLHKEILVRISVNFHNAHSRRGDDLASTTALFAIPVVVIACNRPLAVISHLEQLLHYRSKLNATSKHLFPIIVSLDCQDATTKDAILSYGNEVKLIEQPDHSEIKLADREEANVEHCKIARHYKWALDQIFVKFNYSAAIITEDDLNIAPDFFEYFSATYPLLIKDKSLWCVSAWNDNGKPGLIFKSKPDLLHRTDFFPGLGWMLTRDLWLELAPKWPVKVTWDDWMRKPEQRKNRACIRPEIGRTTTFGRIGVGRGQLFDSYLKFLHLNTEFVPFTKLNLTYLEKRNYDARFWTSANRAFRITFRDLLFKRWPVNATELRITYNSTGQFNEIARFLGIMSDLKSGVRRTAYQGVVNVAWSGGRRLYIVPSKPKTWKGGYDDDDENHIQQNALSSFHVM